MIRFIVAALVILGCFYVLSSYLPTTYAVAFTLGGVAVSWMAVICAGVGALALRATK